MTTRPRLPLPVNTARELLHSFRMFRRFSKEEPRKALEWRSRAHQTQYQMKILREENPRGR